MASTIVFAVFGIAIVLIVINALKGTKCKRPATRNTQPVTSNNKKI